MESIAASGAAKSRTTSFARSRPATDEPAFIVDYVLRDGVYVPEVVYDTTDGAVRLVPEKNELLCRPSRHPYFFRLEFTIPAPFAREPVRWEDPPERPPWITEPGQIAENALSMTVFNATLAEERATFLLVPEGAGALGLRPIDPTIVSNPPN